MSSPDSSAARAPALRSTMVRSSASSAPDGVQITCTVRAACQSEPASVLYRECERKSQRSICAVARFASVGSYRRPPGAYDHARRIGSWSHAARQLRSVLEMASGRGGESICNRLSRSECCGVTGRDSGGRPHSSLALVHQAIMHALAQYIRQSRMTDATIASRVF